MILLLPYTLILNADPDDPCFGVKLLKFMYRNAARKLNPVEVASLWRTSSRQVEARATEVIQFTLGGHDRSGHSGFALL